jgi:hypothetical protein
LAGGVPWEAISQRISAQQHTDPTIERRLDQELEQTFPASDALQITRDRVKTEREAVR